MIPPIAIVVQNLELSHLARSGRLRDKIPLENHPAAIGRGLKSGSLEQFSGTVLVWPAMCFRSNWTSPIPPRATRKVHT